MRLATGRDLRGVRQTLGLSQLQMAHMLGVRPETVNRWENGAVMTAPAAAIVAACRDALAGTQELDREIISKEAKKVALGLAVGVGALWLLHRLLGGGNR